MGVPADVAGRTFQWLINGILQGLPFAIVHIVDVLVTIRDKDVLLLYLWQVFKHLNQNGLIIRFEKCLLGKPICLFWDILPVSREFLCCLTRWGPFKEFPHSSTVQGLSEFLGSLNFYHFFPRALSIIHSPTP